jgi:predicted amidohydrolase
MNTVRPKLQVASAQYPITAQTDFETWRAHAGVWVARAAVAGAQVLVFPEYGAMELLSLFAADVQADLRQNLEALQPLVADFCEVYADLARRASCTIVAPSLPVAWGDAFINRAYVFSAKGMVGWQDKFFMTRFEAEDWGISSAPKVLSLFEADWGSFGVQICYDVEFPLGAQKLCAAGASLIVVPSCTETIRGATRVHVGARARALENQCYTLVAQTVGTAKWSPVVDVNYGYGAAYCPPDMGLPQEGIVSRSESNLAGWHQVTLNLDAIDHVRRDGQVLNLRDGAALSMGWVGEEIEVTRLLL